MTSATDNLGAHLLGRRPSTPDARDYPLAAFLPSSHDATSDPLDAALAALLRHHYTHDLKAWATMLTARVEAMSPSPAPVPVPPTPPGPGPVPPSPGVVSWLDADDPVLDQGQTPRCVGWTGADWENALPVDDHVGDAAGADIYAACKVVDGDNQDGSTIRSLATVLRQRGKLKTYAFASTIAEVETFVEGHGPICWGIGWTDSMFTPDAHGLVIPTGNDIGGHAIIEYEYDRANDLHWLLNHWGPDWGVHGRFCMRGPDLAERLANGGEAMAAVELAA